MSEFTITEAAKAAGVSPKTIRRRLDDGRFPNARKDGDEDNSPWLIPAGDLELVVERRPEAAPTVVHGPDLTILLDELEAARSQVGRLQTVELAKAEVDAQIVSVEAERDRGAAELRRATDDLEQERSARERAEREVAEQRGLVAAERARLEERDRLIEELRSGRERALEAAEAERARVEELTSVLGWRARRRLARRP